MRGTGDRCPGSFSLRTPELALKECPGCGSVVEVFSDEAAARCGRCGFIIYRDISSCAGWCARAEECLGAEAAARIRNGGKVS